MPDTDTKPVRDSAPAVTRRVLRVAFSVDRPLDPPPVVRVSPNGLAIGRKAARGLALDDSRVSGRHATVTTTARSELQIVDEGSKNGTFVNGLRVERATLATGDVVSVGDSCLVVADEPDDAVPTGVAGAVSDRGRAGLTGLAGESVAMWRVRTLVRTLAPTSLTVLLVAETGCGKERVARALHEASGRDGSFIGVNCAAVPENLFESQFFGHKAGAFTGAQSHTGFFREAAGGTLFLDEIGDLPVALQPKLLRLLQERSVVPVGGAHPIAAEVRILAATNRDLPEAVASGSFRGDLLARLFEAYLAIPPLRERREDILPLFALGCGRNVPLTHALAQALLLYAWPFNVREVLATAAQLSVVALSEPLDVPAFHARIAAVGSGPPRIVRKSSPLVSASRDRAAATDGELERLLAQHGGNVAEVARAVGRSRRQVYRWIEKLELDVETFRR